MKITMLGTAAIGYPLAFCDCKYCSKARKMGGKNIRKRASILVNDEMIVDLTGDCQTAMNMYGKNMSNVKYLLQTHTHLDHFDINQFTTLDYKYATIRKKSLSLVCSKKCFEDINTKVNLYDNINLKNEDYLKKINCEVKIVNHGELLKLDKYQIKAIHTTHDEKLGAQLYLIKEKNKTLFYATDTPQISDIALRELKNEKIDCIFLDESFGNSDYCFSHLNIKGFVQFVETLKENELLKDNCLIYATHITHDGNPLHEELEKQLKKYSCLVAYDGMEIKL